MKYISIDLETTGVDPNADQILEFGAIIEDTERQLSYNDIPKFAALVRHKRIFGSPIALEMNARIIKIFSDYDKIPSYQQSERDSYKKENKIVEPHELVPLFYSFVSEHYFKSPVRFRPEAQPLKFTVAGKTFDAFDRNFLGNYADYNRYLSMQKRGIEPAHYFVDWKMDTELPSMAICKERAGINGNVAHIALSDAWDVVKLLRVAKEKIK